MSTSSASKSRSNSSHKLHELTELFKAGDMIKKPPKRIIITKLNGNELNAQFSTKFCVYWIKQSAN